MMRGKITAALALSWLVVPLLAVRGGEPEPRGLGHEQAFELYCAGCHGLNGRGGRAGVPDLSNLASRYGSPLPIPRLVDFVVNDHRVGGSRVCGERVFWRLPPAPFNDHAERATVQAALQYVAVSQRRP